MGYILIKLFIFKFFYSSKVPQSTVGCQPLNRGIFLNWNVNSLAGICHLEQPRKISSNLVFYRIKSVFSSDFWIASYFAMTVGVMEDNQAIFRFTQDDKTVRGFGCIKNLKVPQSTCGCQPLNRGIF